MKIEGFEYRDVRVADGVTLHAAVAGAARRSCSCTGSRRRT